MAKQDLDQSEAATSGGNRRGSSKQAQPPKAEGKSRFRKYQATIDSLKITDIQREFLINRWFDQVDWMSNEAAKNQKWYEVLRSIVIIGSALVPALVTVGSLAPTFASLNAQKISFERSSDLPALLLPPEHRSGTQPLEQIAIVSLRSQPLAITPANPSTVDLSFLNSPYTASFAAFVVSQVVAICAAIDQFFKYGDRWRHYRRSVELLKSEGWQFFQLAGLYAVYVKKGEHEEAFALFANQVETIIRSDVEGYISQIAVPKQLPAQDKDDADPV
jgi:Protein of unknown function (DUF4231)